MRSPRKPKVSGTFFCASAPNGPQIPLSRLTHNFLSVPLDHHVPEGPVNAVVLKGLNRPDDPLDGRRRQRNVVRVRVHEGDMLPVGKDLYYVAGQQRATASRPACPG